MYYRINTTTGGKVLNQKIISYIKNNPKSISFLLKIYRNTLGFNRKKIDLKNSVDIGSVLVRKTRFFISGVNNTIIIKDLSRLINCNIHVYGNNNRIVINERVYLNNVGFWIEDDNNEISIGEHTSISGTTHLAAIEGTSITIGNDCMLSSDIQFRTGDSHSILDLKGKRLNASEDISIGNHVWVGSKVICLKGMHIGNNCILGTSSLVNKKFYEENVIIAGNPARIVKNEIDWSRQRI